MEKISEKESPKSVLYFCLIWFGALFLLGVLLGVLIVLPFLIVGAFLLFFYVKKVKEIFVLDKGIKVCDRARCVYIAYENISEVRTKTVIKGCFVIIFKEPNELGGYVYFSPKSGDSIFEYHDSVKRFIGRIN
jgi:hypothetical protein